MNNKKISLFVLFMMAHTYLYSGQKNYTCCPFTSEWERIALTTDMTAKDLAASFPNGGYICSGRPDEFGIRLPDATVLKRDPVLEEAYTVHTEEFTEKSLGAFATATIGTFITTAIKSDQNRASPQFFLSMVGILLWCFGLILHVYGIVNFQGRASVAATVMSYLVSVIVIVTTSFTPTNTVQTSP